MRISGEPADLIDGVRMQQFAPTHEAWSSRSVGDRSAAPLGTVAVAVGARRSMFGLTMTSSIRACSLVSTNMGATRAAGGQTQRWLYVCLFSRTPNV